MIFGVMYWIAKWGMKAIVRHSSQHFLVAVHGYVQIPWLGVCGC
jgi:hypothetical protein